MIFNEGDNAEVLLGQDWHAVKVVTAGTWSHSSGQQFMVYEVEFDDGDCIYCGQNSLRKAGAE